MLLKPTATAGGDETGALFLGKYLQQGLVDFIGIHDADKSRLNLCTVDFLGGEILPGRAIAQVDPPDGISILQMVVHADGAGIVVYFECMTGKKAKTEDLVWEDAK